MRAYLLATLVPMPVSSMHLCPTLSASNDLSINRRSALLAVGGGLIGSIFGGGKASAQTGKVNLSSGPTNELVRVTKGIRQKRCGGGDIIVSEVGLGTQRWVSEDANGPSEELCHQMLDKAVLEGGINLVETAEQYPIPSSRSRPEGLVEEVIGRWFKKGTGRREKLVISTKITGGGNVNARNIAADCEGSLRRLGTDYIDMYLLHWPARYTPQSNWGQSLAYHQDMERRSAASFEEIALAMDKLIKAGKIRGYGICNDNAFGLAGQAYTAKTLGVEPPCVMQGDFSIINRRSEENGMFEACSPINLNTGFMGYCPLAGGALTMKYVEEKPQQKPGGRGRFDDRGWGPTLYRYQSGPALEAEAAYAKLARSAGMSPAQLALRWCIGREGLTTSLLGTTSIKQLEEGMAAFSSPPLPDDLLWEMDRIHMRNRLPIFSSTRVGADWGGEGEIGERIP